MKKTLEISVYEEFEVMGGTYDSYSVYTNINVPVYGREYDISWLVFNSIFDMSMLPLPPTERSDRECALDSFAYRVI